MLLYFIDTSALVKLYVREPGTDTMLRLASSDGCRMVIVALSSVELRAAVRRRERIQDLDGETASGVIALFEEHVSQSVYLRQPVTESAIETAIRLVDDHGLRAYDALQLASCLVMPRGDQVFCCSDDALLTAARSEGLETFDPVYDLLPT